MMSQKDPNLKNFNIRMPKETWRFLKKRAAEQEMTMTDIVLNCIDKYKKKFDKRLTGEDANV